MSGRASGKNGESPDTGPQPAPGDNTGAQNSLRALRHPFRIYTRRDRIENLECLFKLVQDMYRELRMSL